MDFKELRQKAKMSQKQIAVYFGIPKRTVENWDEGKNKIPKYLLDLMIYKLKKEKII